MKIGILGGTLDPVHNGHIEIATAAMAALGLERVALMPSGDPPHKNRATSKWDRLRMAELAAEAHPGLYASDREIRREGTTYTVDTLSALVVEQPDVEWTYILGADALNKLDTWKEFPRIARLCSFAAVSRPGCDEDLARLRARAISSCYHTRVDLLPVSGPPLSSTAVRKRVAEGLPVDGCVPVAVADYIRQKGLYLCKYSEEQIMEHLKGMLTYHRFTHTLGVADTAQRLATNCGVDPLRARLAGLLHDCAKCIPNDKKLRICEKQGIEITKVEMASPSLLHAKLGAYLAKEIYQITDEDILGAIRWHTTGRPAMTLLEKIIFLADYIEPMRWKAANLDHIRQVAFDDIDHAVYLTLRDTLHYLQNGMQDGSAKVDETTNSAYQYYLSQAEKED